MDFALARLESLTIELGQRPLTAVQAGRYARLLTKGLDDAERQLYRAHKRAPAL